MRKQCGRISSLHACGGLGGGGMTQYLKTKSVHMKSVKEFVITDATVSVTTDSQEVVGKLSR